jgi:uncharacterized protein YciI
LSLTPKENALSLFVLTCLDVPGGLPLRVATRQQHLDFIAANRAAIRAAGPFLNDAGEMCGSMLIIEAADQTAAAELAATDPYAIAGLFESVTLRPWKIAVGALA